MSTNYAFVILLPNARTVNVKATQDTNFLQILEDVCAKQGLSANEWDLKHFSRVIELGNSVRFSGLPNNATLEMVASVKPRVESAINIVLQLLESGKRLTHKFHSHDTLWDVLEFWENAGELSVRSSVVESKDANGGGAVEPVCIYMRQDIMGKVKLQETRLRSLGLYQGSAVIRFMFRTENQLRRQANVSTVLRTSKTITSASTNKTTTVKTPPVLPNANATGTAQIKTNNLPASSPVAKGKDAENSELQKTQQNNKTVTKENDKDKDKHKGKEKSEKITNQPNLPKNSKGTSQTQNQMQNQSKGKRNINTVNKTESSSRNQRQQKLHCQPGQLNILGEFSALLYHADDVRPPRKDSVPDEFYEITVRDVKSMYHGLQAKRKELENAPFQTKEARATEQENAMLKNLTSHPITRVRIRFPDRFVLQGCFRANDSVQTLYSLVHAYLENPRLDFYLFATPPKQILSKEKTLVEEGLIGLVVIYFGTNNDKLPDNYQYIKRTAKLSDPEEVFKFTPPIPANTEKVPQQPVTSKSKRKISSDDSENSQNKQQQKQSTNPTAGPSSRNPEPQPGPSSDKRPVKPRNEPNPNAENVPKWFKGTGRK